MSANKPNSGPKLQGKLVRSPCFSGPEPLGAKLRREYDAVLKEPIPDALQALIAKIREQESKT